MKFRAKMNAAYVRAFHNVLSTMAKLSKSCALKLDQDYLYFIINESGVSGFSAWCQLERNTFFEEYVLEGRIIQLEKISQFLAINSFPFGYFPKF